MGKSFAECETNIELIVTLLHSLGFTVHPDKFVSARSIEYLGFVIDSQSMTISLSQKKKASIKQLCHEVFQEEFLIIRKFARLLGKSTSSFPSLRFGPLHNQSLEWHKNFALIFAKGKFDKKMKISETGKTFYGG